MTTDITELAQILKAAADSVIKYYDIEWFEAGHQICTVHKSKINLISLANPANILALVEALEKAQTINAAAEKLVRCKGRYHSEQNYRALSALFGVKTPDLPPLEHENVHYADAAEMEIAALRQRIAELEESNAQVIQSRDHYKRMTEEGLKQLAEARTVKLPKLKMLEDYLAEVAIEERKQILVGVKLEFHRALAAAGIKVEAE